MPNQLPSDQHTRPQLPSLDSLTGLRFFAALVVLVVHALELATGKQTGLEMLSANAVAFFFVLSGFILTYVYADRLVPGQVVNFYCKRWARIWPLHVFCLVIGFIIQAWAGEIVVDPATLRQAATFVPLLQSWVPVENWAYPFNGPSWSLSTEMAFYFAFPWILWSARRRPALCAFVVGISSASLVAWTQWRWATTASDSLVHYVMYVHPAYRVFDFTVGVLAATCFWPRLSASRAMAAPRNRTVAEVNALVLSVAALWAVSRWGPVSQFLDHFDLFFIDGWLKRGAGCAGVFAWLIVTYARGGGILSRWVAHPSVVYLGRISFAIYVAQYPIIDSLRGLEVPQRLPTTATFALTVTLCIVAGAIFHALIETPCRRWLTKPRKPSPGHLE